MKPKNNEQFDIQTSEQFSDDLKALFEPTVPVGAHIDRAVMDQAARRLRRRSRVPQWTYWAASAAAVLIVAGILFLNDNQRTDAPAPVVLKNDIDRDGAVNILDAFALARQIESPEEVDPTWDTNGDGIVDQKDVDTVAMAAVKLNEGVL